MLFWGNVNIGKSFQMFGNQHLIAFFLVCMGIDEKHEKTVDAIGYSFELTDSVADLR
jgi:hypothetical protein